MDQNAQIIDRCQELLNKIQQKIQTRTPHSNDSSNVPQPHDNIGQLSEAISQNTKENTNTKATSYTSEQFVNLIKQTISNGNQVAIFRKDDDNQKIIIDDIALIQAFYGNDIDRISTTIKAMKWILESKYIPSEWIFIEAQQRKQDACFGWLKKYGVNYQFIKINKESNNIFLKTPLWNIGARKTKASRLCFIDSDVMFCSADWLKHVSDAFDKYDVMSLNGYAYYENEKSGLMKSLGRAYLNGETNLGHAGFTIGMTRKIFDQIHGFEPCLILDDIQNWARIIGKDQLLDKKSWIQFNLDFNDGLPVKLGSTDEVCCHLDHGERIDRKYRQITDLVQNHVFRSSQIFNYDYNDDKLPTWNVSTTIGRILKTAMAKLQDTDETDGNNLYLKLAMEEFGNINDEYPLIVCTSFIPSFTCRDDKVLELSKYLANEAAALVVFSDIQIDGIDTIPLDKSFDKTKPWLQCFRKDVKFPKNSTILYLDLNAKLKSLKMARIPEKIIAMNEDQTIVAFRSNQKYQNLRNDHLSVYSNQI